MAVYTDISDIELKALLAGYDAGDLLSYKGIAEGSENSNYMLHTSQGAFILTLYERRVDPADLPFFLGLMEHLAGKGVSCPVPVRRRDGAVVSHIAGRPAALITFLEGMWIRRPGAEHCRDVGQAMAGLHLAANDFPMRRNNALALSGLRDLWKSASRHADGVEPALGVEIAAELEELERLWPQGLPDGVVHGDLFPDNVFFLGGAVSGLIDFYFACNDALALDIAIGLNAWCFERDGAYNLTKGRAFLDGYRAVRPLRTDEVMALPVLSRGAALRFLLTRLYDWLTIEDGALVTKRDPMEYLRRLRFHRQIASPSEYGIDLT